jgi:hypothetical protein
MTFSSPGFLWVLVLAAPIVGLHMFRWRRRTVVVSTLRFWEEGAGPERSRLWLSRLQDAVSLAIHLLILLLLTAGMADVRIRGVSREPERVLLAIDDTPSMSAEGRLARAHGRMTEYWARALSRGDRVTVALASGFAWPERDAVEGPPELGLETSLPGLRLGPRMEEWTRLGSFDRRAVFTDGSDPTAAFQAAWTVETVGVSARNWGFVGAYFDYASREAVLKVRNFSDRAEERTVAGKRVRLESNSEGVVRVVVEAAFSGVMAFRIEPEDDFNLDQEAYLVVPSRDPLAAVIVNSGPIDPFLWQALELVTEEGSIDGGKRFRAASLPSSWNRDWLGIFDHSEGSTVLPAGRYLLVPAPARAAPIRIGPERTDLRIVWVSPDFEGAGAFHVRRSRLFDEFEGQEAVIRAEQGSVAVRGRIGGVAFAAIGFRLEDSDIQLTPLFPLWVRRSVNWLRDSRLFPAHIQAGSTWRNRYPLGVDSLTVGGTMLPSPGGWVSVTTRRPGVLVARGADFSESTAVNFFDPEESDLSLKMRSEGPGWPARKWWWSWPALSFACLLAIGLCILEGALWARNQARRGPFDPFSRS